MKTTNYKIGMRLKGMNGKKQTSKGNKRRP